MIVARAGETDFCAQFIVSWISALATPRLIAAVSQIQEKGGIASPASGIAANDNAPATSN